MDLDNNSSDDSSTYHTSDPLLHKIFFAKYKTILKLGQGSFGKIYKAEYNNDYYALKFEDRNRGQSLLETEAKIMSYLKGPNIPFIKSYGYSGEYNVLVMQLLGKSLEDIISRIKHFSPKTVCLLGYQMVSILEYIHDRHIIHRDIKPDNFVMGVGAKNAVLYIIDFGLAKKYRSSTTLEQYPMVNKKKLTGTARYASIHALEGLEQSRRDDLESVGYVMMYFLKGHLPWQGLKVKSKEDRYKKILERKKHTTSDMLCRGFPSLFKEFIDYTRNLKYTEEPDYDMLKRKLMSLVVDDMNDSFDYVYDWTTQDDISKRRKEYTEPIDTLAVSGIESRGGNNVSEMETPKGKRKLTSKSLINTMTIYRTTQVDANQRMLTESREATDKVETKCCLM